MERKEGRMDYCNSEGKQMKSKEQIEAELLERFFIVFLNMAASDKDIPLISSSPYDASVENTHHEPTSSSPNEE